MVFDGYFIGRGESYYIPNTEAYYLNFHKISFKLFKLNNDRVYIDDTESPGNLSDSIYDSLHA